MTKNPLPQPVPLPLHSSTLCYAPRACATARAADPRPPPPPARGRPRRGPRRLHVAQNRASAPATRRDARALASAIRPASARAHRLQPATIPERARALADRLLANGVDSDRLACAGGRGRESVARPVAAARSAGRRARRPARAYAGAHAGQQPDTAAAKSRYA